MSSSITLQVSASVRPGKPTGHHPNFPQRSYPALSEEIFDEFCSQPEFDYDAALKAANKLVIFQYDYQRPRTPHSISLNEFSGLTKDLLNDAGKNPAKEQSRTWQAVEWAFNRAYKGKPFSNDDKAVVAQALVNRLNNEIGFRLNDRKQEGDPRSADQHYYDQAEWDQLSALIKNFRKEALARFEHTASRKAFHPVHAYLQDFARLEPSRKVQISLSSDYHVLNPQNINDLQKSIRAAMRPPAFDPEQPKKVLSAAFSPQIVDNIVNEILHFSFNIPIKDDLKAGLAKEDVFAVVNKANELTYDFRYVSHPHFHNNLEDDYCQRRDIEAKNFGPAPISPLEKAKLPGDYGAENGFSVFMAFNRAYEEKYHRPPSPEHIAQLKYTFKQALGNLVAARCKEVYSQDRDARRWFDAAGGMIGDGRIFLLRELGREMPDAPLSKEAVETIAASMFDHFRRHSTPIAIPHRFGSDNGRKVRLSSKGLTQQDAIEEIRQTVSLTNEIAWAPFELAYAEHHQGNAPDDATKRQVASAIENKLLDWERKIADDLVVFRKAIHADDAPAPENPRDQPRSPRHYKFPSAPG